MKTTFPSNTPTFGDNVRICHSPETESIGVAGLIGNVHGETTPSVTRVAVIGDLAVDCALNVFFDDRNESFWFSPALVEFVDHAPGTEITLNGAPSKWVRSETGEWIEEAMGSKRVRRAIRLQTKGITDWNSFHSVCAEALGFPSYYGHNMNAWIDCMEYLDDADASMTSCSVAPGELFHLEVSDTKDFARRLPEIYQAFIECAASVNCRRVAQGEHPVLALVLL